MSDTDISLIDKVADIREEIMLIRIFLRGVLDIIENDSPAIYAVLRENADESERSSYKALVTAFYHLNDRLERLSWPV